MMKSVRSLEANSSLGPWQLLAVISQKWPLQSYGPMHPALPTMAFVPSAGVSDWRVRLNVGNDDWLEMAASAFEPFGILLSRSDPGFLHPQLNALPWARDGATGSSGWAMNGARLAANECRSSTLGARGTWHFPPLAWARCYPRTVWQASEESLKEDVKALGRFEQLVGRLLVHLACRWPRQPTLWAPFAFVDSLHRNGWLRAIPSEPWCCHGRRNGVSLSKIVAVLGEVPRDVPMRVGVSVRLQEGMVCEDADAPQGYRHTYGFQGVVYNATVVLENVTTDQSLNITFIRGSAQDVETEVATCLAQSVWVTQSLDRYNEQLRNKGSGNPECWSGAFDFMSCCADIWGPAGNPACWDKDFTVEHCCTEKRVEL